MRTLNFLCGIETEGPLPTGFNKLAMSHHKLVSFPDYFSLHKHPSYNLYHLANTQQLLIPHSLWWLKCMQLAHARPTMSCIHLAVYIMHMHVVRCYKNWFFIAEKRVPVICASRNIMISCFAASVPSPPPSPQKKTSKITFLCHCAHLMAVFGAFCLLIKHEVLFSREHGTMAEWEKSIQHSLLAVSHLVFPAAAFKSSDTSGASI